MSKAKIVEENPAVTAQRRKAAEEEYGKTPDNGPCGYIKNLMQNIKSSLLIRDESSCRLVAENEWSEGSLSKLWNEDCSFMSSLKITVPPSEKESRLTGEKDLRRNHGGLLLHLIDHVAEEKDGNLVFLECKAQVFIFEDDRPLQIIGNPSKRSSDMQKALGALEKARLYRLKTKSLQEKFGCDKETALEIQRSKLLLQIADESIKHNNTENAPIRIAYAETSQRSLGYDFSLLARLILARKYQPTNTVESLEISVNENGIIYIPEFDTLRNQKLFALFGRAVKSVTLKAQALRKEVAKKNPALGQKGKEWQSDLNTRRGTFMLQQRYNIWGDKDASRAFVAKKIRPFLQDIRKSATNNEPISITSFEAIEEGAAPLYEIRLEKITTSNAEKQKLIVWVSAKGEIEFDVNYKKTPDDLKHTRGQLESTALTLRRATYMCG